MSASPILQVPLHLLVAILSCLGDMQALGSAILSNSVLYAAYKDHMRGIIQSIIRRQIPTILMRYACNAYEASRVDREDEHAVYNLSGWDMRRAPLEEWLHQWEQDPNSTSAAVAASLSRTHSVVRYFCRLFFKDTCTLPLNSELFGTSCHRSTKPSAEERYRVYRALYRFQIYCNLGFRTDDDLQPDVDWARTFRHARNTTLFRSFSPWVNEQLACMHDYLERVLSRAFDEVAAHDVEWGAQHVDWLSRGQANTHKQAYLTYGLHFLYQLEHAGSYDQRLLLLNYKKLPSTSFGLAAHLRKASPQNVSINGPPGGNPLGNQHVWTTLEVDYVLRAWRTDGPDDPGTCAFHIWRYAHRRCLINKCVFLGRNARLRQYGYVMWDTPEDLDPQEACNRVREAQEERFEEHESFEKERHDMEQSWMERVSIYAKGGRGYWSADDLSQVVWE